MTSRLVSPSPRFNAPLGAFALVSALGLAGLSGCSGGSDGAGTNATDPDGAAAIGISVDDAGVPSASPDDPDAAPSPAPTPSSADAASPESGARAADGGAVSPVDGGSPSSAAREKVLAFLASSSGKHTAIGVEDKDSTNPEADSNTMASMAGNGQKPSFWSADWGFGAGTVAARETIVQEGEKQWGEGALVQYIYHACPLTMNEDCQWSDIDGSYGSLSDAQWTDLTTPGGTLYKAWTARLDAIAVFFLELKAAGVAPLFRPLHEINGAWAWWQGRPGKAGSQKLYQITHDYLVNTKGLDNIVWVWNVQDYTTLTDDVTKYNPGPSYFDVAALDVYDTGYTQTNYEAMLSAAAGKPIGVAECQTLPSPELLTQQPLWAYVAMWPDFFSDDTTQIPALFTDEEVLTLSAMPGWK